MIDQKTVRQFAVGARIALPVAEREVVLTYVLKTLDDAGLLKHLAFKGGTCLRKCVYGKSTRFSVDLDFTHANGMDSGDLILAVAQALNKTAYGITFAVGDFYETEDKASCGATVEYSHSWHKEKFKLDISLREAPSLDLASLTLQPQPYFSKLEFKPFPIKGFQFPELLGEKIRATWQRTRSRDLYDLAKAAEKPLNAKLVRALAVIKCWNVRDAFDPEKFLAQLGSASYDWEDLKALIRSSEKLDSKKLIAACQSRYKFLVQLTENEKRLIADARRQALKSLPRTLLEEAGQ